MLPGGKRCILWVIMRIVGVTDIQNTITGKYNLIMDYKDAFLEALSNKELVAQYDRLNKKHLGECLHSMVTGGINYEIDLASGRLKDEILQFDKFFF